MPPGEPRDEFMKRVTAALSDRGEPVDLPDELEISRVIRDDRDIIEEFIRRVEQAKMIPCRVPDEATLVETIVGILSEVGAASAVVPDDGLPARNAILDRLRQQGIHLLDPDDIHAAFTADVGITGVEAAVAETASLCLTSGGGRRRLASLAVPVHIGVVRTGQIVPDLLDWAAHQPEEPPACQTLVSGPSKTADIELMLVTGVHGPRREHVIILG